MCHIEQYCPYAILSAHRFVYVHLSNVDDPFGMDAPMHVALTTKTLLGTKDSEAAHVDVEVLLV